MFLSDEFSKETEAMAVDVEDNAILKHGDQFADYLKKGLSDNWSQVRQVEWYDWVFLISILNSAP